MLMLTKGQWTELPGATDTCGADTWRAREVMSMPTPEVTQLLRGIFNGYFLAIGIAGLAAMALFAVAGRPAFAAKAIRQLRLLHLKGVLINAAQLAVVVASMPLIV